MILNNWIRNFNENIIINKKMYKQQSGSKLNTWLSYSPLLYNYLIITPAMNLSSINSVKWLRGFANIKSSFKFYEGFICITGPTNKSSKSNNKEGGLSLYKCIVPIQSELDDNRLKSSIKLRCHWNLKEEPQIVQQFANNLHDLDHNNMFAISYKNLPMISVVSTRKILQQGVHNQSLDASCNQLQGHKSPVTDIKWVSFPNSGHKIFTSSYDSTIIQWDIEKIHMERHLKYHKSSVQSITPLYNQGHPWGEGPIASDVSNTLASASTDGNIFIWDQRTHTPVCKINAKQKQLFSIECVSEVSLISGGSDGPIKFWDLRNLRQYLYQSKLDKAYGHTGRVRQIKLRRYIDESFTNNNKNGVLGAIKFSSSGDDGKVIQWQQKLNFCHQGHEGPATFDISQDNPLSVSADMRKNIFMVWQSAVSMN